MERSPTENIDIDLFKDDLENIDQGFLQSIISIFSFILNGKNEFLLMTKEATYAYGKEICSWLSLEHNMSKPQRISCLDDMKIVQADFGWNFVAILTDDGRVYLASEHSNWNWKTNNTFRLINTGNDRFKMIACGESHLLLLRQDGHVFAMGDNSYGQITVCGRFHSFSITNNGEIYSWGLNEFGQLGLGDEKNRNTPCLIPFPNDDLIDIRIKDIVAGMYHSLFLFENGQLWGCGSNKYGQLGLGDDIKRSKLTKIPIENVQQIACSKFDCFSLAYDGSSYYAWGRNSSWSSPKKLDYHPTSFASASTMILSSPLTFGLTSTIYEFGSHDSISYQCKSIIQLFDNQDSYDVEFLIDKKRIKASKCYLKSVSEYYRRMFSGNWTENDQVTIDDYSYETYYAYLRMLHTGKIYITRQNITELVDLANCYGDEKLMKYCQTFIRNDLNEHTMSTYSSLIEKYEMKKLYDKLAHLTIEQVLPNVTHSILQNNEKCIKFLKSIYDQQLLFQTDMNH
ncbi:RCC1 and BTB domain-containing protein 2 [Dermatophagoides farinae]|uniref:RCC1 and BTB domain-containing protein 2 n=1 Tax=Dermatophagoides farinae TaxID=6954 RepID=A0A922IHJ1_DERFA|nr:RCC1 and BTB domain-containing protein 2 [Dermatophagoides farinae]